MDNNKPRSDTSNSRFSAILTILAIFIIAIATSSCNNVSRSGNPSTTDYTKGNDGVVISFINFPPKAYAGDSIEIAVQIENKGTYPETGGPTGKLVASGFDRNAIDGRWTTSDGFPTSLPGKSQYNPAGTYDIKTFVDDSVNVPFEGYTYKAPIMITSCYNYKTIASPLVCIDPNPGKLAVKDKPCTIQNIALSGGQGAPIAVTRVEQEVGKDAMYFKVYVRNVGNGRVYQPSAYYACPFEVSITDEDKILFSAELNSDQSPDCTPAGTTADPLRLAKNKEGVIFCKFRNPGGSNIYKTPLRITLDYVYSSYIKRDLEIVDIR